MRLSESERAEALAILQKLKGTSQKVRRAHILLQADGEFVADMEAVLETDARGYDLHHSVVCMDEKLVQLIRETWVPIPATKTHPVRIDYEYERNGTANIFLFTEPLSG